MLSLLPVIDYENSLACFGEEVIRRLRERSNLEVVVISDHYKFGNNIVVNCLASISKWSVKKTVSKMSLADSSLCY